MSEERKKDYEEKRMKKDVKKMTIDNILRLLRKYKIDFDILKIDELFAKQFIWCQNNHFQLTPTLFINGYHYPKVYDRQNLEYFINELIEDDF